MKKIIQFPLVRIVSATLFVLIAFLVAQIALNLARAALSITNIDVAKLLAFVLFVPAVYFAYSLYVRMIEKREMTELGRANAFQEFGSGSLIGFGLFALVVAILWLLGFYRVDGIDLVLIAFAGALANALTSAFVQELIFRAILYRITEQWLGTWWALAISAILFGLIHLSEAGATIFTAVSIALQAGILMGAAYALTGRLWMALGLHALWDFANDGVFGVGISGQTGASLKGVLHASLNGSDLFTGGALGVEASVVSLVITLIAGILILRLAQQAGRFVTPLSSHNSKAT